MCVYCSCQTPEGVVSPYRAITRAKHDATIFSTATNILLMKSNLKFESKAIRCHVITLSWRQVSQSPPPPVTKMRVPVFFRETGRVKSNCARPASSATRGDNEVDHAMCLQAEFHMYNAHSYEDDKLYTTMIYPCYNRSVCFSMGSPAW